MQRAARRENEFKACKPRKNHSTSVTPTHQIQKQNANVFILANQMGTSTEMITKYYGHLMTDEIASHLGDRVGRVSTESEKIYPF